MSTIGNPKKWLAVGALTLVMCAFSAAQPDKDHKHRGGQGGDDGDRCRIAANCHQVPDGGSTAGYLLMGGVVCLGGLFVRSRRQKSLTA
jgi:hypothetical protein